MSCVARGRGHATLMFSWPRIVRSLALAWAGWAIITELSACSPTTEPHPEDSEDACFDQPDSITTLTRTTYFPGIPGKPVKCGHYKVAPGDCVEYWTGTLVNIDCNSTYPDHDVKQLDLKPAWRDAQSDVVIQVGKLVRNDLIRPAYGRVGIVASRGTASLGMTWQWLEEKPCSVGGGPPHFPECVGYDDKLTVGSEYNRGWIDSSQDQPGGQALMPSCCGRSHCSFRSYAWVRHYIGDVYGCGETFAVAWEPDPGGANEPACVKLTFHPLNACDPEFYDALFACIIETPLEFAVCYNGATPESVGWPGVQQVELEPYKIGGVEP